MDAGDLKPGIYIVKVKTKNEVFSQRFIKL